LSRRAVASERRPPQDRSGGEHGLLLSADMRLTLRQLGPTDRDGFAALLKHLSPESRRRRFFVAKPRLTADELAFFTDVDHIDHEAIAAVDECDGAIVGVARYVRFGDCPRVAEVAIEVADAFQRRGVGSALVGRTIQRAVANGFTLLTATTQRENRAARMLLRGHGFCARGGRGGEIDFELEL
jgi:GNAT superfamily N-acetyltransferase